MSEVRRFQILMPSDVGRSEVYIRLTKGPSTLPCETPAMIGIKTLCLFLKKFLVFYRYDWGIDILLI